MNSDNQPPSTTSTDISISSGANSPAPQPFDIRSHFAKAACLDYGFVELIDGMVTDPRLKIVNAARVSYQKQVDELSGNDIHLIRFLLKNGHESVLRHSYFTFRIRAPLFVFRQWHKYQIGAAWAEGGDMSIDSSAVSIPETNWNEQSGRYVAWQGDQGNFYIPTQVHAQDKKNKQGSTQTIIYALGDGRAPVVHMREVCDHAYKVYRAMLNAGCSREEARIILPGNIYSECIWTISLQGLLHFLEQRLDPSAQKEIREYALAILGIMRPMMAPVGIGYQHGD